jgi:uncharacterized membrane protein HdeD (DUF308 family)
MSPDSPKKQTSPIKTVVTLIAIGTIAWLIAGMVALTLDADSKYIWTCVVGALLGVTGIRYSIRRDRRSGI